MEPVTRHACLSFGGGEPRKQNNTRKITMHNEIRLNYYRQKQGSERRNSNNLLSMARRRRRRRSSEAHSTGDAAIRPKGDVVPLLGL